MSSATSRKNSEEEEPLQTHIWGFSIVRLKWHIPPPLLLPPCWSKRQFSTSVFTFVQFSNVFWNSMILPAALSGRFLFVKHWCLCVLRTLPLSLSRTCAVVGGRRFRPSVAVVDGCRFRPTSGRPESTSMIIIMSQQQSVPLVEECWQPSELSVEERNLLSGANKFSSCWWMLLY